MPSLLCAGKENEGAGARTQDLRIKSPLLYQLSYTLKKAARGVIYPLLGGYASVKKAIRKTEKKPTGCYA
jgi:hypothetical protein